MSAGLASAAIWTSESGQRARAVFAAQGIRCAACSRTIERAINALGGIERVSVNPATSRVSVDWRPGEIGLPQILRAVDAAGFTPVPAAGEAAEQAFQRARRTALKRIGVAGLGMMQVMMYVFGIYFAAPGGIDPDIERFLNVAGMLITTPVLLYSGAPFLLGALQAVSLRSLTMDVPVAIALVLAFAASAFNTVRGTGATYFDSVTMFIFLLGVARYIEMTVRHRSLSVSEALSRSLPATVQRLQPDGTSERVPLDDIAAGNCIRVPRGAVVPVDVELVDDEALIDESLLTGESTPQPRRRGDALLGGSVNAGNVVVVRARRDAGSSTLASIVALLERAQHERPRVARTADRVAGWFVAATLALAALVAISWSLVDPARAFPAVLAVLVVTCPCALSLATPAAVAAATTRLAKLGVLVTRADALERLAGVDTVVLDKTGTLTTGTPSILRVVPLGADAAEDARAVAAALARNSSHPIASALGQGPEPALAAGDVRELPGDGITGRVGAHAWRLGRLAFVASGLPAEATRALPDDGVYLGHEAGLVARFEMGETLRDDAVQTLDGLRRLGITPVLASGDRQASVDDVARALDIEQAYARLDPARKLAIVRELQASGRRVLMMGDGINDGPVLAAADVSCAMGQGSAIAQAAADFMLLTDSLRVVAESVALARRLRTVIRQNLRWAISYNFAAVPLAALGLVDPWLAALGMSVSSLVVVLNARRLAAGGGRK